MLDPTQTQPLEDFWEEYQLSEEALSTTSGSRPSSAKPIESERSQSPASASGKRSQPNRAISSASESGPLGQGLSPHHPALSLPTLLSTFGPLVYPLYKAALLRKRILMVTQAPVELACNFGTVAPLLLYNIGLLLIVFSVRYVHPFHHPIFRFRSSAIRAPSNPIETPVLRWCA